MYRPRAPRGKQLVRGRLVGSGRVAGAGIFYKWRKSACVESSRKMEIAMPHRISWMEVYGCRGRCVEAAQYSALYQKGNIKMQFWERERWKRPNKLQGCKKKGEIECETSSRALLRISWTTKNRPLVKDLPVTSHRHKNLLPCHSWPPAPPC